MADLIPDNIETLARRRIGPAPLGVWIGGAAVIVAVGAAILRRRRTGTAAIPDAPTETVDPVAAAVKRIPTEFVAGGSATGTSAGTGIADPLTFNAPSISTNADWRRRAETWAIGNGYPALVTATAIARYLGSEPLTAQERAIVDAALVATGPTPEPVSPPLDLPGATDTDTGSGPPAAVIGDTNETAPATWRKVSLTTIGNLNEYAAMYNMGSAEFLAALQAGGYDGWQSTNGGPIYISVGQPDTDPQ